MTFLNKLAPWAVGLLAAMLFWNSLQGARTQRWLDEERMRADSLAADAAAERLRADGWQARFATVTRNLAQALGEMDIRNKELVAELEAARVRINTLVRMVASASGQVESQGREVEAVQDSASGGFVEMVGEGALTRHWVGDFTDGPLTASWDFELPKAMLSLEWSVSIPGEIIQAQTGDGRVMVTGRSLDPRATLEIGEVLIDPPPPVEVRKLDWKLGAVVGAIGVVVGAVFGGG